METVTSKFQYIVQGDRRAVNKSQGSLNVVNLFQLPRSRDILTAVLFLIRAEPDNGDLRVFCNPVSQDLLLEIQHSLGVLVQFDPPVRQTGRFLDSVSVAGEGGERAENGGPIRDGHPGMLCRSGMGQFDDVIVWSAHA